MKRAASVLLLSSLTALAATGCGGREPATPNEARTVIAVLPSPACDCPKNEVVVAVPAAADGALERPRAARLHETVSLGYAGDSPLTQIPRDRAASIAWNDDGHSRAGGDGYGGYGYGYGGYGYGYGGYGHDGQGHGAGHGGVASSGSGGGGPVGQSNLIFSPLVQRSSVSGRGPSGGTSAPRPSGGRRGPR